MTRRFYDISGGIPDHEGESRTEEAEGLGKVDVVVYYPDRMKLELPPPKPPKAPTLINKLKQEFRVSYYLLLRSVGLGRRRKFSHLPEQFEHPIRKLWRRIAQA